MLLHEIGYTHLAMTAIYDEKTKKAVETIQAKYGLIVDGVVGPLTKISLYNEVESLKMPRLSEARDES